MRNGLAIPFEEELIDAIAFIEQPQRRFQALGEGVNRRGIETLVVDALQFENEPASPDFVRKTCGPMKPKRLTMALSEPVSS